MRVIAPLVFMIIFLAIIVGANIYLARRFGYYFGLENLKPLYIIFVGLTIYMIGGLVGFTNSLSLTGTVLYKLAAVIMGFVLYLLLVVLFVDLLSLFLKILPVHHGIIALSITALISLYGVLNAYNTRVVELEVPVKGLIKETTIMHLTDIHIGHFRGVKFLDKIVDLSNQHKPDMVVITGDLFDGKIRLKEEILKPLERIEAPAFFIEGNHDGYTGVEKVKELVRKTGVRVLENEIYELDGLQIVGLNHMLPDSTSVGMHATFSRATIKNILPSLSINQNQPSLLLHHSPDGIQYAAEAGIDLYLAGHTHAGQLFPVTLLNDLIFKYNRGLHNYNGTNIYVSPGAGTFGPPMRIGTRSEIAFIKLVPEE